MPNHLKTFTVKSLIEHLQTFDENLPVAICQGNDEKAQSAFEVSIQNGIEDPNSGDDISIALIYFQKPQQCYKSGKPCDCPGLCRESC